MPTQSATQRPIIEIAAEVFVFMFTAMAAAVGLSGLSLFAMGVYRGLTPSEAFPNIPVMLEALLGEGVALALGFALLIAIGVRWRHVLMPQRTEAERARPLNPILVVVFATATLAGVMSLVVVVAGLFKLSLTGWVAGFVDPYAGAIGLAADAAAPCVRVLFGKLENAVGGYRVLAPYWLHTTIVLAVWPAQLALFAETFPVKRVGRARVRQLALFGLGWFAFVLVGMANVGFALVGTLTGVGVMLTLVRLFGVLRGRRVAEGVSALHEVSISASQLAIPILAALVIWLGHSA